MAAKSEKKAPAATDGSLVRSMTGFGRKEVVGANGRVVAEIRSVNGRFLKISVKVPPRLTIFEERVKKLLKELGVRRGTVDVYLSPGDDGTGATAHAIDRRAVEKYLKQMRSIGKSLKVGAEVSWQSLLALPGVVSRSDQGEDIEAEWDRCVKVLREAGAAFERMRVREGRAMVSDVRRRLKELRTHHKALLKEAPRAKQRAFERLRERIASAGKDGGNGKSVSRDGLEREIVLLADRMDVSEELARLDSHFQQMEATLARGAEVGKKLDFLTQELFREVNTIGSKAQNEGITHRVVEMKGLVEKIREQVQNLE